MTKVPWKDGEGDSTCLTRCENGWTSNGGETTDWVCERCNPRCETCEDQGVVGDKDKCLECSLDYPFLYPDKQTCFVKCEKFPEVPEPGSSAKPYGLYQVDSDTCGRCDDGCLRCAEDKFNCTKCDLENKLALFQKKLTIGGRETLQGSCRKRCVSGYYLDDKAIHADGDPQWVCRECLSPCSQCENDATTCTACDGSKGRQLLW
jgi:hypothetical protein